MNAEALKYEIQKTQEHLAAVKANIADWETKLAADMKRLEEMESSQPWQPETQAEYYFISAHGTVGKEKRTPSFWIDDERVRIGNCFPSQDAAYARLQFMQLLTQNNLWGKIQESVLTGLKYSTNG